MRMDFVNTPVVEMAGFKGGPGTALVRKLDVDMGSVVQITLPVGAGIGYHQHLGNCEVVYIISGTGECHDGDNVFQVSAGAVTYCPEGHSHGIVNNGTEPLTLLGILPNVK